MIPSQIARRDFAWKTVRALAIGAAAHVDLTAAQTARPSRLLTLAPADLLVICLYFALVLGIGVYLKAAGSGQPRLLLCG